ncbi:MAG: glycerol-3-phosphate acyltransferase [Candidatus Dormibacteraeota bacterium]|uniref:Glycerol-3-phosphate acyltransferase n=1 Tax=Candidatus Amunia macphersoniae TaxID=3127014 RepID=A0A934KGY3_9BACT|nr:glycerol-3-phosphate acyltransferase [Candidatus Dormibacteraeota bacterium]
MKPPAIAVVIALLVGAYLVGSVPVAWLLGRWRRGVDLREVGSGNPGTSNLFRNAGMGLAVLSGPVQFAQGVVPVLIARGLGADDTVLELAAVCAVGGNGWPVWFGFHGQRCIAVATGAAAAIHPALLLVLLVCFAAGALAHAIALGVLGGFCLLPIAAAWIGGRGLAITCCALLAAVILRRLEGLSADLRGASSRSERQVLLRRLFLDERPGQILVGPRDEAGTR